MRGEEADIGGLEVFLDVDDFVAHENVLFEAEIFGLLLVGGEISAGEDEEFEGFARPQEGDGFLQVIVALQGAEFGSVEDERFVGEAEIAADFFSRTPWRARGEEVVDDVDGGAQREVALGFGFQKVRDGGDGVGAIESVADGGAVAGVAGEECGVGAVEGGDQFGALGFGEHGVGEHGGGGVGDGVVDVQNVEVTIAADLGHFHGEREGVVGIGEGVEVVDFDGVVVETREVFGEAEGAFVADEVDFMAAAGEFFAEGGGEDAAAADGGVAGDADVEKFGRARTCSKVSVRCGRVWRVM